MRHATACRAFLGKWIRECNPKLLNRARFKKLTELVSASSHKTNILQASCLRFIGALLQTIRFYINGDKLLFWMTRSKLNAKEPRTCTDFNHFDGLFFPRFRLTWQGYHVALTVK